MSPEELNTQLKKVFRIEAGELLAELETCLLELERCPGNNDLLNRAFRALHTLKGSGATSGFTSLSTFLHEVEEVFANVRDGTLTLDSNLIDLSLQVRDVVDRHLKAEPPLDEEIIRSAQPLLDKLRAYAPNAGPLPPPPPSQPDSIRSYRLQFAPHENFFQFGHDPGLFLDELRALSETCTVSADTGALPSLDQFQPEACYLAWTLELTTSASEETLREVFLFAEDECDVAIECLDQLAAARTGTETAPVLHSGNGSASVKQGAETLRVGADKLDSLVDMVGELVILRSQVSNACALLDDVPGELESASEGLQRLTTELRDLVLEVRTVPIGESFQKFRRLTRDLSRELGKQVELSLEGTETAVDKSVAEQLRDPLLHLVRNALDHGFETPEERHARGKPPTGHLQLSAEQRGDRVWITIRDDGRGIDPARIRAKAIERGVIAAEAPLSDEEAQQLIFHAGFSTAAKVSEVSGRGVGLDVVRKQVELLRGSVSLSSRAGEGTTIQLSVPLTLAIIDGLMVGIGADRYVFPLAAARETVELPARAREYHNGRNVVDISGELIPYLDLRGLFDYSCPRPPIERVVIVELEGKRIGLVVDEVVGNHQTVLKSLGWLGRHVDVFSGATILGDGRVCLICDLPALVRYARP